MKFIKSLGLAFCLLMASYSAQAKGDYGLNTDSIEMVVSRQIINQFQFPEALIGKMNNSTVVVKFQVEANKSLKVLSLDCTDSFFKLHLIKELESTQLYLPEGTEEFEFSLQFLFKADQL